ncbi:MAG: alpha/beta hydrolase [Candidatus Hydrogenedentes bacterium]|nr:alpha/beta hydrolase [Candidatus Hydrogenedentota bacterium]
MGVMIQKLMLAIFKRLPDSWLIRMAGGKALTIEGRTLDPMLQLMATQAASGPALESLTVPEARAAMKAGLALTNARPRVMSSTTKRIIPTTGRDIPVRVYRPQGTGPATPVVLYFHQGGHVIGDPDICEPFCTLLADVSKCVVMSVDNRLAPEHPFPAPVDDALTCYRWLCEHAPEIGGDPTKLIVAGDSAGGQLAAVICQQMKTAGKQMPIYQILIYPWVQAMGNFKSYDTFGDSYPLSASMMEWFADHYLNDPFDKNDTRVSPLLEQDLSGLPPAHVITAGFDPLSDEGEAYANKLRDAGVPVTFQCYEHLSHAFTALGGAVPKAQRACEEIADELKLFLSKR